MLTRIPLENVTALFVTYSDFSFIDKKELLRNELDILKFYLTRGYGFKQVTFHLNNIDNLIALISLKDKDNDSCIGCMSITIRFVRSEIDTVKNILLPPAENKE